jgi:hypothetical protein
MMGWHDHRTSISNTSRSNRAQQNNLQELWTWLQIVKCEEGLQITLGSATGAQPTHTLPQKAAAASSSGGTSGGGAPQATGGAQPPGTKTCTPSFVLLDIDNSRATVYVYQLLAGKVKVDRVDLSLPPKPAAAG